MDRASLIPALKNVATRLRIDSIKATSEAGSGHPTSCCSAAELVAALFFAEMRFDPQDPHHPGSDRFVLSKGHAAPILYAAWAEAGAFDRSELLKLRTIGSDLGAAVKGFKKSMNEGDSEEAGKKLAQDERPDADFSSKKPDNADSSKNA